MLARITSRRPSPALVISCIALFVALSGVAYAAALPKNSVGTRQIKTNGVSSSEIKAKAVSTSEIKDASIQPSDLSAAAKVSGPTGPAGPAGTARAYAQVDSGANAFVAARTKGFTAYSRPSTGTYCLTLDPALGINPLEVAAVASPEYGSSALLTGRVLVRGIATNSCPAGDIAVHTVNDATTAVNTVSFMVIVP